MSFFDQYGPRWGNDPGAIWMPDVIQRNQFRGPSTVRSAGGSGGYDGGFGDLAGMQDLGGLLPSTTTPPIVPPGYGQQPPAGGAQPTAGAPQEPVQTAPIAGAPEPVSGAPAPTMAPENPVIVNNETGQVESLPPISYQFQEGPSWRDRLRAVGLMMSAAGTPQFSRVTQTVTAGLNEKQMQADQYNRNLSAMTRPRYEEATDKDGRLLRKTYPALYEYDAATSTVREIPGAASKPPTIEVLYDPNPTGMAKRETYKDVRGLNRYKDTNEYVNPEEVERADRQAGRGDLTPAKAGIELQKQQAVLREIMPNYTSLQSTLADTENPFADVTTLFQFMKLIDPGSVVRANEADMFSNAGSLPTQLANSLNQITNGGTLTDAQQKQLSQIVDDLMVGQIAEAKRARGNWDAFFDQDAQLKDNWDKNVLNPYDILYGSTLEQDILARREAINTPTISSDDQAAIDAIAEEERLAKERIRLGLDSGGSAGNPRLLR